MFVDSITWTQEQMDAFEDECFRSWLNIVDARLGYDERRAAGSVAEWRHLYEFGDAVNDAIVAMTS